MSKLKCPRCKSEVNEDDTFCMSCGNPIKKDVEKKIKEQEEAKVEVKEEIKTEEIENVAIPNPTVVKEEVTPKENKPKSNKAVVIIMLVIILGLLGGLSYFVFFKEEKECEVCKKCPKPEPEIIEKEPTVQYINFSGYRFEMPLDWNFEGDSEDYKFTNEKENIYVLISKLDDITYSTFISEEYQKIYVEKLQSDYDIFINNKEEKKKDNKNYYIMEGTFESYNYIIIVTENEDGIFLTEAQFESNSVYTNKKQEVIDFAISYNKNGKI